MQATSTKIAVTRYEKRPTRRVALSSVRSGRRGVGRGLGYEVEVRGRGRVGGRVGSGTRYENSQHGASALSSVSTLPTS